MIRKMKYGIRKAPADNRKVVHMAVEQQQQMYVIKAIAI